jgi:hypothetical protein
MVPLGSPVWTRAKELEATEEGLLDALLLGAAGLKRY